MVPPKPYKSVCKVARFWNCSGAMYPYVPTTVLPIIVTETASCTAPKSTKLTVLVVASHMIFSGLMSL
eukprot:Gb_26549 [translate_table: standard]